MSAAPTFGREPAWWQKQKKQDADDTVKRLAADEAEGLRFLWNDYESEIGYRSCAGTMVAASMVIDPDEAGPTSARDKGGYGHEAAYELDIDEIDRALKATRRIRRARSALVRMNERGQSLYVTVLYRVYGPMHHHAPYGTFGDLAQIVDYTDVAQWVGKKKQLPVRAAIESVLRDTTSGLTISNLRIAAEKLLCEASQAYREALK